MTALAKPDGGVRRVVVGDVFRRVVARTIAQQFTPLAEAATPFQYALSTRAGTECVTHIVQSLLVGHPVNHFGNDGDKLIAFIRQFYSGPSR